MPSSLTSARMADGREGASPSVTHMHSSSQAEGAYFFSTSRWCQKGKFQDGKWIPDMEPMYAQVCSEVSDFQLFSLCTQTMFYLRSVQRFLKTL